VTRRLVLWEDTFIGVGVVRKEIGEVRCDRCAHNEDYPGEHPDRCSLLFIDVEPGFGCARFEEAT
jgi:hypothetical protein